MEWCSGRGEEGRPELLVSLNDPCVVSDMQGEPFQSHMSSMLFCYNDIDITDIY